MLKKKERVNTQAKKQAPAVVVRSSSTSNQNEGPPVSAVATDLAATVHARKGDSIDTSLVSLVNEVCTHLESDPNSRQEMYEFLTVLIDTDPSFKDELAKALQKE